MCTQAHTDMRRLTCPEVATAIAFTLLDWFGLSKNPKHFSGLAGSPPRRYPLRPLVGTGSRQEGHSFVIVHLADEKLCLVSFRLVVSPFREAVSWFMWIVVAFCVCFVCVRISWCVLGSFGLFLFCLFFDCVYFVKMCFGSFSFFVLFFVCFGISRSLFRFVFFVCLFACLKIS